MLCIKFWKYTNKTSRKPYFRLMTIWKAEPISAFEFRMFYQKVISWKRPGKLRYASHTEHTHRQAVTFVMVRRTALESFNEAVGRLYCAGQKECCFHTRQMNGFVSLSFRLFGFWALFSRAYLLFETSTLVPFTWSITKTRQYLRISFSSWQTKMVCGLNFQANQAIIHIRIRLLSTTCSPNLFIGLIIIFGK